MPRTASGIVFPRRHWDSSPNAPVDLYSDPRYTLYERTTVLHWQNGKLDWFCQEQDVFLEKETGKYFWPDNGQMIEVIPEEATEKYFFKAP